MNRKALISLSLLLVAALLFSGVAKSTRAQAQPIERIRVGLSGAILNLDPRKSMGAPSYQPGVLATGGQLFRWDQNRNPQPDLVESYEVSADGLTYTMKLFADLKFSDGTPLTTEDVLASWEQIKEAPPVNKTLITPLPTLEATDARTLVWKLGIPQRDFLHFLCFQFLLIHPKDKWADEQYFNNPLSAAPYMLKEWTPGSPTALVEENPNYPRGPMAIKQIEFVSVPDLTSRTLQLAQGDLDYVFDLPPSIRGVISEDVTTFPNPIAGMYHIVFNLKNPDANSPLLNRDVREAISLAIDRDKINERAFFGISKPAQGFLFSGVPESYAHLPNGGKRDLEAAKALLATTPFKDGFTFTLGVWGERPGWRDAVLVIRENLAELNITAEIESMPDATAIAQLDSGNYQAQFSGNASFPPVVMLGNQFLDGAWTRWARYESPQMADLFAAINRENDPDKRIEAFKKVMDQAYKDLPLIPVSERAVLSGTRLSPEIFRSIQPGENFWVARLADMK